MAPAVGGLRADNGSEPLQPTLLQAGRCTDQASAFSRGDGNPFAQLSPEDGVLGFQIVEAAGQLVPVSRCRSLKKAVDGFIGHQLRG